MTSESSRQLTSVDTFCNRVASDENHELQMQLSHQVLSYNACDSFVIRSFLAKCIQSTCYKTLLQTTLEIIFIPQLSAIGTQTSAMGKVSGRAVVALIVCFSVVFENVNGSVMADRVSRVFTVFWLSITNYSASKDPRGFNNNQIDMKAKRPFCNAFTGCGRKRSNEQAAPPPQPQSFEDDDTSVSELLELNSEPAIENLMRQIMSEAKMYEAIQEANREMFLQKLKHSNRAAPSTFSLQ